MSKTGNSDGIDGMGHHPIITVGHPAAILPPWAVVSPILAAGLPPIITEVEPMAMVSGGPVQVTMSPAHAAGMKPISTLGHPGGRMGPPTWGTVPVTMGQACMSPTLAAGGIAKPPFDDQF
jgi:hypothetical protein